MSVLRKLTAIAMILLMQGPAMLVQEVAWVKMLVSYTQERGIRRGVIETFDGKHPCDLCRKAEEIRRQQQPADPNDKQAPSSPRVRHVWVEMMTVDPPRLRAPAGCGVTVPLIACALLGSGRCADAPVPPPPEMS